MQQDASITVLVTCYKEGPLLERALSSVAAQTDRDVELVVVNDASPCPETNAICRRIPRSERVKVVIRRRNGGPAAARNTGVGVASASVIVPLDGDDVLPADCIDTVRAAFRAHPEADYCFGNYCLRNADTGESRIVDCSVLTDDAGRLDPRKYAVNYILYGGSPYRRALWERMGGYRPGLNGMEDQDFWMRSMGAGAQGIYIPRTIYEWHRSGRGVNATVPHHRVWEAHVRNRVFHRRFGNWATVVEGFLDYAIEGYADAGIRRMVRRSLWCLWPLPRGLGGRFFRAAAKCTVPARVVESLVNIRRDTRQRTP